MALLGRSVAFRSSHSRAVRDALRTDPLRDSGRGRYRHDMVVEITLLGPPRVRRDGGSVTFETRKAVALLAHLAMTDRPRPRAALCELLYPGHDPERARGALRRTLSALRQGVGEEWLETEGDGVRLRRGAGLSLDVERFRELASGSGAQLLEAVELFPGDFLEGFSLRDSADFDDWQAETADALRSELGSALRRLVDDLAGRGELEEALPWARRRLALDPLHEPAHRELIRLYACNGDRSAALDQYRTCVRILSEELGVAPLEETVALSAQVNEGTVERPAHWGQRVAPTPPQSQRPPRAGPPDALPLVGRADQLQALLDAHEAARPDGAVAVVEGEAGIGKTRLATELVRSARAHDAVVLVARCHEDEIGLPYGPVVELLGEAASLAASRGWAAEVPARHLADAALLQPALQGMADLDPDPLPLGGPGAQVRLLDSIVSVVGAACAGRVPGVVLIEDAHAADDATLEAISYLGRRLRGRALLLVLTWRTERIPVGHRLRRLAAELAADGRAITVRPARLDEDEVGELVRTITSETSSPELVGRIYRESEGVPLFVAECLAGLTADAGPRPEIVPATSLGLLDARLAGLSETARQVLGAAAAIGRSFDPATLRRASGRSDEETVAALEELLAHGWVREGAGDTHDFSHQKLRELVYESTALARRQLLHGRIAAALAGPRTSQDRAALVAQHLRLAGDLEGAAEHHRLAADHAASLYAHADALEHLETSLALGHPDVAGLHERIGDLRTVIGDYGNAVRAYETAGAYATDPQRRAAIEHKLGNVSLRRGEWDRAETHLQGAIATAGDGQRGLRARAQTDLGLVAHHRGDPARATRLAREALELAGVADDRAAEAQAHNMLGMLARTAADPEVALDHLDRSLGLARALHDAGAEAAALNNLALVRRDAGELAAALELTERALALCARLGDRHREAALENNLADLHHQAGDDEEAMTHLKRAVRLFQEVGADEAARLPEIWKLVSW